MYVCMCVFTCFSVPSHTYMWSIEIGERDYSCRSGSDTRRRVYTGIWRTRARLLAISMYAAPTAEGPMKIRLKWFWNSAKRNDR